MDFLNELKALGTQIIDLVKSGIDFASGQVPIVAQQALTYWTTIAYINLIWVVLTVIVLAWTVWLFVKAVRTNEEDYAGMGLIGVVASLILLAVSLCAIIPEAIKATVAPTLFFLEHAAKLFQ